MIGILERSIKRKGSDFSCLSFAWWLVLFLLFIVAVSSVLLCLLAASRFPLLLRFAFLFFSRTYSHYCFLFISFVLYLRLIYLARVRSGGVLLRL